MRRRAQRPADRAGKLEAVEDEAERTARESGDQSGDIQGLSTEREAADESVAELAEEGQAFEAGVVEGVEEAEDNPERPTFSHEDLRPLHESELPPEQEKP